jgi:predicted HTH domain antitoxin
MDFSKMKIAELKEELRKRGAPLRGRKTELVER